MRTWGTFAIVAAAMLANAGHADTYAVDVQLRVLVDANGSPKKAVFIRSAPAVDAKDDRELIDAAIRAAMTWTFDPSRDGDGKPMEAWVEIPVHMDLADMPNPAAHRNRAGRRVTSASCEGPDVISESSRPVSTEALSEITTKMSVAQIVRKIGPAERDVASGVYILEWSAADGRKFWVHTPSLCGKPDAVGYKDATPSKHPN